MHFTKMHGLGNDYLYVYGEVPDNIADVCQKLSDRHFGAGSDGMIYISPSATADFKMRIFNADGSEAMMCGNGIRCVGKYVYDKGYTDKTHITVETLSGIKTLDLRLNKGKVEQAAVDMGYAVISDEISVSLPDIDMTCVPVSVGNPHAVFFVDNAENVPVSVIGPIIEHNNAFEGGVNVEFVRLIAPNKLRMRVWERGSGVTMACGTGACASAAAAVSKGMCEYNKPIRVQLDGGILEITVTREYGIIMTGPAEIVYEGYTDIC